MKQYQKPYVFVIWIEKEDVITTSGGTSIPADDTSNQVEWH